MGDFALSLACVGEGSPTVIFENGYGVAATYSWKDIQPAISTMTRTCRYDRRGMGLSSWSAQLDQDMVRTIQDQVDDLVLLLETAEIEPPYVLVGHSWGGLIDLLFTEQYPDWVEGLVLLDAVHPRWNAEIDVVNPQWRVELIKSFANGDPERALINVEDSELQVASLVSVGERPLAVVTAMVTRNMGELEHELWLELQTDFLTFSTNSRQIILENSDHFFQEGNELNLVIDAILWVLDEVRAAEE
jgi:pimeloyl-ACP methyl ester carboxylesterase